MGRISPPPVIIALTDLPNIGGGGSFGPSSGITGVKKEIRTFDHIPCHYLFPYSLFSIFVFHSISMANLVHRNVITQLLGFTFYKDYIVYTI